MRSYLVALSLIALLHGCLRTSTTIVVRNDGSAQVIDTVLFPAAMMAFFEGLSTTFDSTGSDTTTQKAEPVQLWNDSSFTAQAALMGHGVTYHSSRPLQLDSMTGYVATFEALDINGLNVDKNSFHSKMDNVSDQAVAGKTPMVFTYHDGMLTINNPRLQPKSDPTDSTMTTESAVEQLDMAATFMKDMSVVMRIRVDGTILETNASFVQGSDITMMEFHFGELIDSLKTNPKIFMLMKGTPDQKPGQLEEAMNSLGRGARFELKPIVTVRLK